MANDRRAMTKVYAVAADALLQERGRVPRSSGSSRKRDTKLPSIPIWYGAVGTGWNLQFGSWVISVHKPRHWKSAGLLQVWRDFDIDREY